ncbi:MAG: ABC transporter permease subunit [Clostridiales bacterium]|jgi:putative aldouronate transport system permease protein|nr:ABC transporter permease subunit [Clostridiales bacterium]
MNAPNAKTSKSKRWKPHEIQLYSMAWLGVLFLLVFSYLPMFGILLAFKDGNRVLDIADAIFNADFAGFANFREFLTDQKFRDVLWNTVGLNVLMLAINFPAPILFALLINEVRNKAFKKGVQTVTNFPHFISWIIFGGIVISLTDMTTGVVNPLLNAFGLSSAENPADLRLAQYFWAQMIILSLIKGVGWGSIVYLAAIAGISPDMYEAARIDGANRFTVALKITLPMIAPTVTVFLLLNISRILNNSFEQFYSLQKSTNLTRSEVLATYLYFTGFGRRKYSYAAAMGLFDSLASSILLVISNFISKRIAGKGLF